MSVNMAMKCTDTWIYKYNSDIRVFISDIIFWGGMKKLWGAKHSWSP